MSSICCSMRYHAASSSLFEPAPVTMQQFMWRQRDDNRKTHICMFVPD